MNLLGPLLAFLSVGADTPPQALTATTQFCRDHGFDGVDSDYGELCFYHIYDCETGKRDLVVHLGPDVIQAMGREKEERILALAAPSWCASWRSQTASTSGEKQQEGKERRIR
jgi:hypothetical protein